MTSNLSSDFSDEESLRNRHKDNVELPVMQDCATTNLMQNLQNSFNQPLTSNPHNNTISQIQTSSPNQMDSVPQSSNEGMKLNFHIKLYGYYKNPILLLLTKNKVNIV